MIFPLFLWSLVTFVFHLKMLLKKKARQGFLKLEHGKV